jgi:ketosteroid isomerase-like protein
MKLFSLIIALLTTTGIFAQKIPTVDQVIDAENNFVELARDKGIKKAFLAVSDENTIVFRPGPVSAEEFYKGKDEIPGLLSWKPMYARISKSGDWGYTTGPYTFQQNAESEPVGYGDYFSVWKKAKNGNWKLALDIGIPHKKPVESRELMLDNPLNTDYPRLKKKASYDQRDDMAFSNDQLFSTVLKANGKVARKEFLAENTRLLFPGYEPIIGKAAVTQFWDAKKYRIISEPLKVDRAVSGELAFTYGKESLSLNGKQQQYYYLRIWELQPSFKWALLVEVVTPDKG